MSITVNMTCNNCGTEVKQVQEIVDHLRAELDRVTKERDESFQVIEELNRHLRNANEIVGTETMGAMGALISERDDARARVEKLEAALRELEEAACFYCEECSYMDIVDGYHVDADNGNRLPCVEEVARRALEGK